MCVCVVHIIYTSVVRIEDKQAVHWGWGGGGRKRLQGKPGACQHRG